MSLYSKGNSQYEWPIIFNKSQKQWSLQFPNCWKLMAMGWIALNKFSSRSFLKWLSKVERHVYPCNDDFLIIVNHFPTIPNPIYTMENHSTCP